MGVPELNLCFTDPGQYLVSAGEEPDDPSIDHDLSVDYLSVRRTTQSRNIGTISILQQDPYTWG